MQRLFGILAICVIAELPLPGLAQGQDEWRKTSSSPNDEHRSDPRAAAPEENRFRLTRPSSGFLLTRVYPRRMLRIELVVSYDRPGTVLDTVGIDAAPVGSFALLITDDEHFQFQVYDPGQRSNIQAGNGWHVLRSRNRFAPDQRHTVEVTLTDEDMTLRVNGREQASAAFVATLSGRPLYVGDIPDDDHWGGGYNIHPAMTGEVTVNSIGPAQLPEENDASRDLPGEARPSVRREPPEQNDASRDLPEEARPALRREPPARMESPRAALSNEAIETAFRNGRADKGKDQALILRDTGRGLMNALNALADEPTEGSGFWIEIHTPFSWLAQLSSDAAKEYRDISRGDLEPADLAAVLRVTVHPDLPDHVSRSGMRLSASVEHVVIRPKGRKDARVLQPLSLRTFDESTVGRHGRVASFAGVEAIFDLDAVARVRDESRDGEFDVIVIGSGDREKTFSVKKKHFDRLPGLSRY